MATNDPLEPSMIFRSRTTKASSNVTEQKASRRSLLSSMSLMRTSVMTTVVLLFSVAQSKATPNQVHARTPPFVRPVAQRAGNPQSRPPVPTQGEQAAAAAAHQLPRRLQRSQPAVQGGDHGTEPLGR